MRVRFLPSLLGFCEVAQQVVQQAVNLRVAGSSPAFTAYVPVAQWIEQQSSKL